MSAITANTIIWWKEPLYRYAILIVMKARVIKDSMTSIYTLLTIVKNVLPKLRISLERRVVPVNRANR